MGIEIQKGSVWKRFSAHLFDIIMIAILTLLFAFLLSWILQYDGRMEDFRKVQEKYETEYGISFSVSRTEYEGFDETTKAQYDAASAALNQDPEAVRLYNLICNLALVIVSGSLLISFLIWSFILPLIFKNGRTLGKLIFGLCVVRPNAVRITGPILFVRSILGACVIETMVPVYTVILFLMGQGNIFLLILLAAVLITNAVLFLATRQHRMLHDLLAVTVVADYATQKIFETEDALIAYTAEQHAESVKQDRESLRSRAGY